MDNIIRIGGASVNQTPIDWAGNLNHIIDVIKTARNEGIEILCLPEQAIPGYGCEDLFLSHWLPEKAKSMLEKILDESEDIILAVGMPVVNNQKLYNCACVVRNKKLIGIYAKKFLANDGIYYETRWFTPRQDESTSPFSILGEVVPFGNFQFTYKNIKIGFEICQDMWEGDRRPACQLHEKGINLILNPSASHFTLDKSTRRRDLVVNSSREFNCTYELANLLGNEAGKIIFDGQVLIAQEGRLINTNSLLSYRDSALTWSDVNFSDPDSTKTNKDPNRYSRNEEFVAAAALGLFDYVRKSKNRGFVISLSGGADSSACAVLTAEMTRRGIRELGIRAFLEKLGRPELITLVASLEAVNAWKLVNGNVLACAYQASDNSSSETFDSASALSESLGAEFYNWKVSDEAESYVKKIEKILKRKLQWSSDDIAMQNIQARARSPIIWLLANIRHYILITTSNRSEGDLGYATMDGDTSGSLAPIAAIDKHFIRQWLVWAEKELHYEGLEKVNKLIPTAELRPKEYSQSDENDLMPYAILVEIERLAIRDKKSPVEIYTALMPDFSDSQEKLKGYIKKFFTLWSVNQWKRERTAPSFHLDDFTTDPRSWCRFPILSGSFVDELKELDSL